MSMEEARKSFTAKVKERDRREKHLIDPTGEERRAKVAGKQEAQAEATEDSPETQESEAPKTTDPTETRYERARRAMLRAGWTADEIAEMDREKVRSKGRSLLKAQARQDAVFDELKKLRDMVGNGQSKEGQGSPATQDGTVPKSGVSVPDRVNRLIQPFEAELSDESIKALRESYTELLNYIDQRTPAQSAATPDGVPAADAGEGVKLLQTIRGELQARFPELADDDDASEVLEVMQALDASPAAFKDVDGEDRLRVLMTAAARAVGLREVAGERMLHPKAAEALQRLGVADSPHLSQVKSVAEDESVDGARARWKALKADRDRTLRRLGY